MKNEILDYVEEEKIFLKKDQFIYQFNIVFSLVLMLSGTYLMYHNVRLFYFYRQLDFNFILMKSNYELFSEYTLGFLLFSLGFFCYQIKKAGLKTIGIVGILMVLYFLSLFYFGDLNLKAESFIAKIGFLLFGIILIGIAEWDRMKKLYS